MQTLRHLYLDQIVPLQLSAEGQTVLHASSVALDTVRGPRAVLFIGPSGAGKSSMAAGCWTAGATLLADDFSVVRMEPSASVIPALVGVRLWGDVADRIDTPAARFPVAQYNDKERLVPRLSSLESDCRPVPIGVIVLLESRLGPDADLQIDKVAPAETLMRLVEHSHRLDVTSAQGNRRTLEALSTIVENVPSVTLKMPARLDDLATLCAQAMLSLLPGVGELTGPGSQ